MPCFPFFVCFVCLFTHLWFDKWLYLVHRFSIRTRGVTRTSLASLANSIGEFGSTLSLLRVATYSKAALAFLWETFWVYSQSECVVQQILTAGQTSYLLLSSAEVEHEGKLITLIGERVLPGSRHVYCRSDICSTRLDVLQYQHLAANSQTHYISQTCVTSS